MPTTNARKHTIPLGTEQSFTRLTIFEAFGLSIRDVVPVANLTERAQLVTDLTAKGQEPSATKPLLVHRADAPGLHRIEYTTSATGAVWLPASGTLFFASKPNADSFATANSGLLSIGDECQVGATKYLWTGTKWLATDTGWLAPTFQNSWVNATPAEAVEVRRLNGMTVLKGRPALGTTGTAFTLDVDFRPKHLIGYTVRSASGGATTTVDIQPDGRVQLVTGSQPYLGIISFPADA
ncbi:hypothetical protein [Streptomyces sp. AC495_CC817]|uniref:hypothetical protein n=1 Tax=Streptomyces sp. AC495_CC817 TaxID=2823900 RepID=UPI001C2768E6|nr:hypothetical protein [Streptomyces sp. AC495_CC817]